MMHPPDVRQPEQIPMSMSLESLMRDSLEQTSERPVLAELGWFVLVGGGAMLALAGFTTAMISLRTGAPDWLVGALCYAAFVVPVYLLHRRLSFRSSVDHRQAFPRYLAVQVSAIVLVSLFSWLCYTVLGIDTAIGSVIVLGLTAALNFVVLKLWAFATGP
jgi:putative flippase GtrA